MARLTWTRGRFAKLEPRPGLGWPWPQAQIAGISPSTTSVAVVYAVMVETGYIQAELGKIILQQALVPLHAVDIRPAIVSATPGSRRASGRKPMRHYRTT